MSSKKISWSEVSKLVGWEKREVRYPSMEDVEKLYRNAKQGNKYSLAQLLKYHRFLRSPENEWERWIMDGIMEKLFLCKHSFCD